MADDHKTKVEQDANRIINWLVEHRSEFEQGGADEASLPSSVGLSEAEVREAVDHLENHEYVARSRFVIKPARGWPDVVKRPSAEGKSSS